MMYRVRSSLAFLLLGIAAHGQIAPATSGLPSSAISSGKITAINSGVTLSPTTVSSFPTFNIGAINGVSFNSSNRYVTYSGGTTQWINIHLNFDTSGLISGTSYYLSFMVTNVQDNSYASGLAIDSIASSTNVITQGFETGSTTLPSGWVLQGGGTRGIVSNSATNFAAAAGSQFAFIDTNGASGSATISTTAIGGTNGTILNSPAFSLTTGSTLDIKVAFFSNDGAGFLDFALVQLFKSTDTPLTNTPAATLFTAIAPTAVPEPSTVALLMGCSALGATWWWRRRPVVASR